MKTEDVQRAIAGGNKVLAEALKEVTALKQDIARVCPSPKKKRIRQSAKPLMNKLESEFFERLKQNDCFYPYPQAVRFRLANGITYTPDFFCLCAYTVSCYDVKGKHVWDDAIAKVKMAAHEYPQITWKLVWKENGVWQEQVVLP